MTTEELLDHIVVPRANGSRGLVEVGSFIERTLREHDADVVVQQFTAVRQLPGDDPAGEGG